MARAARFKLEGQQVYYHVYSRVAGSRGEYPLNRKRVQRKLINVITHYAKAYFCEVAAFSVMGNHYHVVLKFEKARELSRQELMERAKILYPSLESEKAFKFGWTGEKWERFNKRLFDVSEYMRNVQSCFARWYNRNYERQGRFWADRFKSTVLVGRDEVLDCMIYIELNSVRAGIGGIKGRPEEYTGASMYYREKGSHFKLMDLSEVIESEEPYKEYKARVYYRGVGGEDNEGTIPEEVLLKEQRRGFKERGVYRKRIRYFVEGVAIGGEDFIRAQIEKIREKGQYIRRRNPISQLQGISFTIREQRRHAVYLS